MDQRGLKKEQDYILDKVKTIEESLPLMMREMIDYYIDKQLKDTLDQFVQKQEFNDRVSVKLDHHIFNEYIKKQQQEQMVNDREFKVDQRLFLIEQGLAKSVQKEELKNQLKMKVSNDKIVQLRDDVHKLQVMSISQQEKIDKQLAEYDSLMAKNKSELDTLVHDINIRVKVLEVDMYEQLDDDEYAEHGGRRSKIEQLEALGSGMMGGLDSERGKDGQNDVSMREGLSGSHASPADYLTNSRIRADRRGAALRPRFRRNDATDGAGGSASPSKGKNKKKGGPIKVDEETKGMMKGYEEKLEDLRKQSFQEINRLEAMMEQEQANTATKLTQMKDLNNAERQHLQN